MAQSITEIIKMERNMDLVSLCGPMDHFLKEISKKIKLKDMVNLYGLTKKSTRENGMIIKWVAKVYLPGLMAGGMRATTLTMLKKGLEN